LAWTGTSGFLRLAAGGEDADLNAARGAARRHLCDELRDEELRDAIAGDCGSTETTDAT